MSYRKYPYVVALADGRKAVYEVQSGEVTKPE